MLYCAVLSKAVGKALVEGSVVILTLAGLLGLYTMPMPLQHAV
jgi:hypothetical protein